MIDRSQIPRIGRVMKDCNIFLAKNWWTDAALSCWRNQSPDARKSGRTRLILLMRRSKTSGALVKTIKYSKFRIILFISVCNFTLPLTIPYHTSYLALTLPYITLRHTLHYLTSYLTLPYILPYITVHLTLPYHTLCLTIPYFTLPYVLPYHT